MFDRFLNGAVVTAHPDDETIWAGGLLASFPGRWTVICCSIPKADPIRAWKFFGACATLGATARLLPFVEPGAMQLLTHLEALDLGAFDAVVTHNAAGEYGHLHHRQVHNFVLNRRPDAFTFGFRPDGLGALELPLDHKVRGRKQRALECYDHISSTDGVPKWRALTARYGAAILADKETYDVARA